MPTNAMKNTTILIASPVAIPLPICLLAIAITIAPKDIIPHWKATNGTAYLPPLNSA